MRESRIVLFLTLAFGALSAWSQTPRDGRYALADTTLRKYTLYQDTLRYRPGWSGTFGGAFAIRDMAWESGRASFCIRASHSWGDYGWSDYDECVTGRLVPGRTVSIIPGDPGFAFWYADTSKNLLALTGKGDSLRALVTVRPDTVRLSFWWIYADSYHNLFLPGHVTEAQADVLTRIFARRYQVNTSGTVERVTAQLHSMTFVRETGVGVGPAGAPRRTWRRPGSLPREPATDPLGRRRRAPGT